MTEVRRSQRIRKVSPKAAVVSASSAPTKPTKAAMRPPSISPPIPGDKPNKVVKTTKSVDHFQSTPGYHAPMGLFEMASLGNAQIRDDFREMGYPKEALRQLMATKEPEVDSSCYPKNSAFRDHTAAKDTMEKKLAQHRTSPNRKRATTTQEVYPWPENKNWVLFNHVRGWPPHIPEPEEGSVWHTLSTYEPGNKKVVVFNIVSGAIGLRTTPAWMAEKKIVYAKSGPRVLQ